ncbi:hypothetical protein TorRG33x02_019790 [Trema orientale]|uniref:Uncharacterized protein n=1 Tax=Trema orientale TaxID=63057 RepID=A0A2P5FWP8_TREOI|nr:hypothetical protein TorRG33x02_019790 [Trema orientale]
MGSTAIDSLAKRGNVTNYYQKQSKDILPM